MQISFTTCTSLMEIALFCKYLSCVQSPENCWNEINHKICISLLGKCISYNDKLITKKWQLSLNVSLYNSVRSRIFLLYPRIQHAAWISLFCIWQFEPALVFVTWCTLAGVFLASLVWLGLHQAWWQSVICSSYTFVLLCCKLYGICLDYLFQLKLQLSKLQIAAPPATLHSDLD